MRRLVGMLCLCVTLVSSAFGQIAPTDSAGRASLHFCVHDVGLSFGNAPRVHGLRLALNDRGLERVDGLAFALYSTRENRSGQVLGIALNVIGGAYSSGMGNEAWGIPTAPWLGSVDGLALSPFGVDVARQRGFMVCGLSAAADRSTGIQVGGIAVGTRQRADGVQVGGLANLGSVMNGISLSSIVTAANASMWGLNVGGGVLAAPSLTGINAGTFVVSSRVRGLTAGAFLIHDGMAIGGINAAGLIGAPWMRGEMEVASVGGLTMAGGIETRDLTGLSVAGYHHVTGVQRGIAIALYNDAVTLRGVQLGVINRARNNPGAFRVLPIANAHWGD